MSGTVGRIDPFRAFNFRVKIDNTSIASFSEVSGLSTEINAADYREGADLGNFIRKLPGLSKCSNITLKRGYVNDSTLWDWFTAVRTGAANARRNGKIALCDETQKEVLYFEFTNGFIAKLEGAHMTASGNEVAIESADLVIETLMIKLAS